MSAESDYVRLRGTVLKAERKRNLLGGQGCEGEIALGFEAQRGALADVLAEQVPGRDLWDAELLGQLLRLRAFARTRRSE